MKVYNVFNGTQNDDTIELEFMPHEISYEYRMPITSYNVGR